MSKYHTELMDFRIETATVVAADMNLRLKVTGESSMKCFRRVTISGLPLDPDKKIDKLDEFYKSIDKLSKAEP